MSVFSRKLVTLTALMLMGLVLTSNAWSQVDYSGTWQLDTQTLLPDQNLPCVFSGTANVIQSGSNLSGTASLTLVSGPGACPSEMTAAVSGMVKDGEITLGLLLDSQLGEAQFYTRGGAPVVASSESVDSGKTKTSNAMIAGSFNVTAGPYMGLGGPWSAMMVMEPPPAIPTPTLAFYGILLLTLLLVTIGGLSLRHRRI